MLKHSRMENMLDASGLSNDLLVEFDLIVGFVKFLISDFSSGKFCSMFKSMIDFCVLVDDGKFERIFKNSSLLGQLGSFARCESGNFFKEQLIHLNFDEFSGEYSIDFKLHSNDLCEELAQKLQTAALLQWLDP